MMPLTPVRTDDVTARVQAGLEALHFNRARVAPSLTLETLRAHGAEIVRPPRTEPYGQVAVFRDIAGNLWDLLSERDRTTVAEPPRGREWFAVRMFFAARENQPWGPTDLPVGQTDYEERVTLWQADSPEAAVALAQSEAQEYADDVSCEVLGLSQVYSLSDVPGHGVEAFSLIRRSGLDDEEYLGRHFDTGTGTERQHKLLDD